MRTHRFAALVLLISLTASALVAVALAQEAAAPPPADDVAQLIEDIRAARTSSQAVAAYARAQAAAPDSAEVTDAFIRKVVSLGVPVIAETQAQDMVARDPKYGLGWAVLAYVNAARNDTRLAVEQIARAARLAPGDPFVQRTAGQIMAWYEVPPADYIISAEEKRALSQVRTDVGGRPAYAEAFRDSRAMYEQARGRKTEEPVQVQNGGRRGQPQDDFGGRDRRAWDPYWNPYRYPSRYPGGYVYLGGGQWTYDSGYYPTGYYPYGYGYGYGYGGRYGHHRRHGYPYPYTYQTGEGSGPMMREPTTRGPLFVGPGSKDRNVRTPVARSPTWEGSGGRTTAPPAQPQPGLKPTGGTQPGLKPSDQPPPGTKR